MEQVTITLRPSGERFAVPAGQGLMDALRRHGVPLEAPCGGRGTCGKCAVLVNGKPELACRYRLTDCLLYTSPSPRD